MGVLDYLDQDTYESFKRQQQERRKRLAAQPAAVDPAWQAAVRGPIEVSMPPDALQDVSQPAPLTPFQQAARGMAGAQPSTWQQAARSIEPTQGVPQVGWGDVLNTLGAGNEALRQRVPGYAGTADVLGRGLEWEQENIAKPGLEVIARGGERLGAAARGQDWRALPNAFDQPEGKNLRQSWEEREIAGGPLVKTAMEILAPTPSMVLPVAEGIGLAARGARAAAPKLATAVRAVDRAVTSPETQAALKRITPGATVEAVGDAGTAPMFYSVLERTLQSPKAPGKATAEAWRNFLQAQGVKPDEVKWTGVDDFLNERRGKPVAKAELQEWVDGNRVEVQEVVKRQGLTDAEQSEFTRLGFNEQLTPTQEARYQELKARAAAPGKFGNYTLPGGENYRELLITLPQRTEESYRQWLTKSQLQDTPIARSNFQKSRGAGMDDTYRSSHWDEPNVLAHVRFNDRTAADGKKTLFIEEVQSDWHQAGRQKGYVQPVDTERATMAEQRFEEINQLINKQKKILELERYRTNGITTDALAAIERLDAERNRVRLDLAVNQNKNRVPTAPFAKTWPELALKRVVRWASENGYDRVAWTTGKMQAERYDLSKQVSRIDWNRRPDGSFDLKAQLPDEGSFVGIGNNISANKLSDYIGKDPAEKVLAASGNSGILSGIDLKVGGEGMRGFYDAILPEVANKLGKKFGARVGATSVSGTTVHALDITPAMRQAAMSEGFPLFSAPEIGGAAVGGLAYQDDPNLSPEENAQRRLAMAAGGAGVGYLGRRLGSTSRLGGTVEDVSQVKSAGPTQPPQRPGYAGNIKLDKFAEELQPQIQATYDAQPEMFDAARRGVRSDAQVRADAINLIDSVGGNGQKAVNRWKPGQAWNAEELLALREVLSGRTQNVIDAQRALREVGDSTENLLKLRLALEEQALAQKAVSGVTAEAGRALRQLRQTVGDAVQSRDVARMERLLATKGGRGQTQELAQKLAMLDLDNPDQVYGFIRTVTKPGMMDYLTELFYNSILSGPKTHAINAISNTVNALASPVERAAAAAVEAPLAKLQGRPRARFFGEVMPDAYGIVQGIPEGARAAAYVFKHGFTPEQAIKLDFPHQRAFTGTTGRVINAPSTALEAADQMFKAVNNRAALNALAYRQAASEGLKGKALASRIADILQNPTKERMAEAEKTALYRLFRQEPGDVTSKVIGLRESSVFGLKPLRFVIPFVRTPANLLKYGLERSPAGWLNPKLWQHIAQKSPEAADEIGRAALGSMFAAAIALYAADGKITGAAPTSAAERDRFYREGKQPYAVKVGDTWVQYSRLEPFNQSIGQVAAAVEAINAKDKSADQKAMQAVASIAKGVVSQTYLSGLADFIEGLSDPWRSGERVGTRLASAIAVPFSSATRTIAQAGDPVFRKPQGLSETIQAGVPGLSQNVPARLTAFGQEARREAPLGETFRALSPINVTPAKNDPVDQELGRLSVNVGFVGNSIRGVSLTEEEQRGYQRVAGRVIKADLDAAVANPEYQRLDEGDKAIVLERIIRKSRERAGLAFLERFIGVEEMKRRMVEAQAR